MPHPNYQPHISPPESKFGEHTPQRFDGQERTTHSQFWILSAYRAYGDHFAVGVIWGYSKASRGLLVFLFVIASSLSFQFHLISSRDSITLVNPFNSPPIKRYQIMLISHSLGFPRLFSLLRFLFFNSHLHPTEQVTPGVRVPGYVFGKQSTLVILPSSLRKVLFKICKSSCVSIVQDMLYIL